jgi:8-oxoguanine deaminase
MSLRLIGASRIWYPGIGPAGSSLAIRGGVVVPDDGSGQAVDVSGCVITPGLINAHHHLFQSLFRTLPGTRGVPMRDWLPRMAQSYARVGITPRTVYAAARVGLAESLLSGVTTVADHHLSWPAEGDGIDIARAVERAARELGARVVFVRGSAGGDAESAAASADAIAAELTPARGGVSDDGVVQVALGPAGVHSDGEATFRLMGEVADDRDLRRRTQSNEQVDVERAMRDHGRRPLELLDEWGWLTPRTTLAHLCDVTAREIALLASRGCSATHAPGCDVPMGWGIAPVRELMDAGIEVGLGTSGGGSNDAGHLLADARLAMQVSALVGPQLSAESVLASATVGSARGLGRAELGNLEIGAAADIVVWDVSGVADAGVADPVAGLLWAHPGRRPRHVLIAGRFVVRDYRLVHADEDEIVAAAAEIV